jgi:beta-glucosidase
MVGSLTRPLKELKGFQKVFLEPGESKDITFTISSEDLAFYDIDMKFKAEEGKFRIYIGGNSRDVMEAEFSLME